MTPLDALLKLIGFAIDKAQQGQMDEMKEALTKVCFELDKRRETEAYNIEELRKLRETVKLQERRITDLILENNILKRGGTDA